MADSYYSDRVRGSLPRVHDTIGDPVWKAVLALIERGIRGKLFAEDFPTECEDRRGTYACDRDGLLETLRGEVPELGWPLSSRRVPDTLAILDALEFLYRHASAASAGKYHSFFDHHHLHFDRAAGRKQLRDDVNRLLARNGLVYELNEDGRIARLAPKVVEEQLRRHLPPTRDERFDKLLETATRKYADPDPAVRRDGVEKLWDAFERSKTLLEPNKKKGLAAMIRAAATSPREAEMLEAEMKALTDAGNDFAIRHHETRTVTPDDATVDHLFARMYAFLLRVHPALR
jgi:hypothetical protein